MLNKSKKNTFLWCFLFVLNGSWIFYPRAFLILPIDVCFPFPHFRPPPLECINFNVLAYANYPGNRLSIRGRGEVPTLRVPSSGAQIRPTGACSQPNASALYVG